MISTITYMFKCARKNQFRINQLNFPIHNSYFGRVDERRQTLVYKGEWRASKSRVNSTVDHMNMLCLVSSLSIVAPFPLLLLHRRNIVSHIVADGSDHLSLRLSRIQQKLDGLPVPKCLDLSIKWNETIWSHRISESGKFAKQTNNYRMPKTRKCLPAKPNWTQYSHA